MSVFQCVNFICVYLIAIYEFIQVLVLSWSYMWIYNSSLYIIFFTFYQFKNADAKTLFSFLNLGATHFFTKIISISLFSMAGVPPFWGFFAKLFIFTLVRSSYFFSLYPFFFLILFIGLYFYIQNIRLLNSTAGSDFQAIIELNARVVPLYYYTALTSAFFLVFGCAFTDDLLLIISWTLF